MKHYLNVCDVDGDAVAPVDIITFGSPCQDLSVAGKRAGLNGKRSGLFMEAIRIIREMREKTNGKYPTFAIWENVPGAFSSKKGEDFRAVLEEISKIKDGNATIPRPPKGKWADAGAIMGDGWSVAYRVLDAQFHGVPQRRRRILLVADFAGERAGKILFNCHGLPGYPTASGEAWQGTPADAENRVGADDKAICLTPQESQRRRIWMVGGVSPTLDGSDGRGGRNPGGLFLVPKLARCLKAKGCLSNREDSDTLICIPINDKATRYKGGGSTRNGDGAGNGLGVGKPGDPTPTLTATDRHAVFDARSYVNEGKYEHDHRRSGAGNGLAFIMNHGQANAEIPEDSCPTLNCNHKQPMACHRIGDEQNAVRRLTPTECARLQGFPDWWSEIPAISTMSDEDYTFWCDVLKTKATIEDKPYKVKTKARMVSWYNKLHNDGAEYRMWGNGVALPVVRVPLHGMAKHGAKTLGSLFDGSGGFPLAGLLDGITPLWVSEIEPYPIAVTKYQFGRQLEGNGEAR